MKVYPEKSISRASTKLRAIAHPLRLTVLSHLIKQPMNVSELLDLTNVSQPNISQHLAKMRALGIVDCKRKAQNIYYSISDNEVKAIIKSIKSIFG